ncbi:hypothetical protein Bca52824_087990 [Brassica carinata]|uniref:WAT1-related protein n=1 Tax=Brassica carinata TaxID=52824 RepID=A0A8X7PCF3_BRACI|nr:hypothetical protein Bca52824_087990 [Brassica carinata]
MEMEKYKPVMALVLLQFTSAGVALFTKAAFMEGLNPTVFVVYRQAIATLFICPISFFSAWIKRRSLKSVAKVIGTGVCVGGAMAMTFLRGPKLLNAMLNQDNNNTWLLGCLCLLVSTFAWSSWLILQVQLLIIVMIICTRPPGLVSYHSLFLHGSQQATLT